MKTNYDETKEYYSTIDTSLLCDCSYCQNYRIQIKKEYPEVCEYLESLGIDSNKPFETSPLEIINGKIEYCCCQYIVFGSFDEMYSHRIKDVEFRKATSYPETGIEREHFVIEFFPICLKWVV